MVVMDDFIYTEPQPLTPGAVPSRWVPVVSRAVGYARVTVQSGQGVVAYASAVDNLTNDPTTVDMLR